MSLASLESTINGAFEARDTVSTTTKGEVRDAVDHALLPAVNCVPTMSW